MSLFSVFILTVLICSLLILSGTYALPIQADEKGIALAGGMGESVIFNLAIEEVGSKMVEVDELNSSQVVKEVEEDSGVIAEIPTQEISKGPALTSGYWRIVGIIIGISSLLIFIAIYLIKKKKI